MTSRFRPTRSIAANVPVHGPFRSRFEKRVTQQMVAKYLKIRRV